MVKLCISIWPKHHSVTEMDAIHKSFEWLAVPRKDEELDLCDPGIAGGHEGVVYRVKHWLGTNEVDVYAHVVVFGKTKKEKMTEEKKIFESLKEEGWRV